MLSLEGRSADRGPALREVQGGGDGGNRVVRERVFDLVNHVARGELRVVRHLPGIENHSDDDAGTQQRLVRLLQGFEALEELLDDLVHLLLVLEARPHAVEPGILDQLGTTHEADQALPGTVAGSHDHQVTVLRTLEHAPWARQVMETPASRHGVLPSRSDVGRRRGTVDREQGVHHADVDVLSLAGS